MNSKPSPLARFLRRSTLFVGLQAIMAAVVIGNGSPDKTNHYLGSIQDKMLRLEQCDGSRLVVIGGSNVAFGMNSQLLQQSVGMDTVNLGLHASLGLCFSLECYLQNARAGDLVIVCPEYHSLLSQLYQEGDPMLVHQLFEHWPEARRYFPGSGDESWKTFLDRDGLWLAHQWVGRAVRTLRHRDTSDKVYTRSSFNEFGDMVAHHGRSVETMSPMDPIPALDPEIVAESIEQLNRFHAACKLQGVDVFFSYPPLLDSLYAGSAGVIEQLHAALRAHIEIPILNEPHEFAYGRDHFFDTGYHLNEKGCEARTRFLAAAIEQLHVARQSTGVERVSRRDPSTLRFASSSPASASH